ncbi:MAG: hypothetical protein LBR88_07985 [Zoogloeaceae bacterium]|jgi:hypothetical protein|nr:hypothetical protein [Zoogloeaceae bacterium]
MSIDTPRRFYSHRLLYPVLRPLRLVTAAGCLSCLLLACATTERLQESTQNSKAAGELIQDAAIAGAAYKLLLPTGSELILLGLIYVIYDPLAPNWEIETTRVSEDVFRMQLTMKRFHTGGEGEAQYLFRRNARRIAQAAGYDDYLVLRYEEGIESATRASRRFSTGEIRLVQAH